MAAWISTVLLVCLMEGGRCALTERRPSAKMPWCRRAVGVGYMESFYLEVIEQRATHLVYENHELRYRISSAGLACALEILGSRGSVFNQGWTSLPSIKRVESELAKESKLCVGIGGRWSLVKRLTTDTHKCMNCCHFGAVLLVAQRQSQLTMMATQDMIPAVNSKVESKKLSNGS